MSKSLEELLRLCTVRISLASKDCHEGTGFFAAPDLILTCAHVVQDAHKNNLALKLDWQGREITDVEIYKYTDAVYPDLALLKVNVNHAEAVGLYDSLELNQDVYIYGYPDNKPNGDSATLKYEGSSHQPLLYKLKAGQIRPGFSGSPVLNLRTGLVCAMIESTRDNSSDMGGRAVPVSVILQQFLELKAKIPDNPLAAKLKEIEKLYTQARYDDAYQQFCQLCETYPNYQAQAATILARYSDFQTNVTLGVIPFNEQNTAKLQIAASFQMCLKQFKKEYL